MVNRVILVGNLTADGEAVSTTGKAMTRIRLATHNVWYDGSGKRREAHEFHTVICFNKLAEVAALYCVRGTRVYVEGRLRTREYVANDGTRRYATEIVADVLKLLQSGVTVELEELTPTPAAEAAS